MNFGGDTNIQTIAWEISDLLWRLIFINIMIIKRDLEQDDSLSFSDV